MQWDNPKKFEFNGDGFFIGQHNGKEIGISTERHAITIAGAGSGKGATCIIPNIKRWKHNLLVIDPKGENARETVKDREAMGQKVYVIDPFDRSKVDKKYIARFNPMSALDKNSPTLADDIFSIADGVVMRGHDASSENWDDGAQELIAGLIAFSFLDGKNKNLEEMRDLLSGDKDFLQQWAKEHSSDKRAGGLIRAGADRVLAKEGVYYISNAQKNTAWLDREVIIDCLSKSDFDLSELKNGNASVYLVLPANYLVSYGRLLRMFVRCSIEEMARPAPDGKDRNKQCLFMLDEFFALGKIQEIAVASGLMRGYGLQLWPVLQDLGQLTSLYGQEGSQTFFQNADLHQFFGIADSATANYVSTQCGYIGLDELSEPPPVPPNMPATLGLNAGGVISSMASGSKDSHMRMSGMALGGLASMVGGLASSAIQASNQSAQEEYQQAMNEYQREIAQYGKPRLQADEIRRLTQKRDDIVADASINLVFGADRLLVSPLPYFQDIKPHDPKLDKEKIVRNLDYFSLIALLFALGAFAYYLGWFADRHLPKYEYGWNSIPFYQINNTLGLLGSPVNIGLYKSIGMFAVFSSILIALWRINYVQIAFLILVAVFLWTVSLMP